MAQISEITLQQLEGATRIDPEFYKPVFLTLFNNKNRGQMAPTYQTSKPRRIQRTGDIT